MPLTADDISTLYTRHARALVGFFVRRTFDAEVAVELMAETFAVALEDRGAFRGDGDGAGDAATGWLYGIARHQFSGWLRHEGVKRRALTRIGLEPPSLSDGEVDRILELAGSAQVRQAVAAGLERLGADHREAVRLRVVEEQTYPELAARLGVSEQTARARVSRGLRALGRTVGEELTPGA